MLQMYRQTNALDTLANACNYIVVGTRRKPIIGMQWSVNSGSIATSCINS